jgi:undecaprenyl-diphosphatase
MLDWLIELDKELLLAINGWNSSFFDPIMVFITNKWSGIPIYAVLLFMIFYKRNLKVAILMFFSIIITFALTDWMGVHLFKRTFERLRPCWDPTVENLIRILEYKGGRFGFISNHAANFFGLAVISSGVLKKNWYTIFIFCWSAAVAYSRVYVGKHFPGDVICGAMFGALVGYIILLVFRKIVKKYNLPQDAVYK